MLTNPLKKKISFFLTLFLLFFVPLLIKAAAPAVGPQGSLLILPTSQALWDPNVMYTESNSPYSAFVSDGKNWAYQGGLDDNQGRLLSSLQATNRDSPSGLLDPTTNQRYNKDPNSGDVNKALQNGAILSPDEANNFSDTYFPNQSERDRFKNSLAKDSVPSKSTTEKIRDVIIGILAIMVSLTLALIMWLLGMLLSISGLFVDYVTLMTKIAGSSVVQEGWTFTRDMLNFVFIIMLLVIAFSTIAGLESYGMKKLLPRLLIAALLVNFSLAIAGVFLQFANIMKDTALSGLNSSNTSDCKLTVSGDSSSKGTGTSLACSLANSAGINKQYSFGKSSWGEFMGLKTFTPDNENIVNNLGATLSNTLETNLGSLVSSASSVLFVGLFVVAMIVLAITLLVRLIMLALLCILAPVPYVFSIVPKAEKYAAKWWDTFIQYLLFLPVVVFFLVLAIRMTKYIGGSGIGNSFLPNDKQSAADAIFGATSKKLLMQLFDTVFVSVFILISVFVAKAMGIYGADAATGFAKNLTRGTARVGAKPGVWAAKTTGRAVGAGTGLAARGAGTLMDKMGAGGALRGGRAFGRAAARLATGSTSTEQIEAAQKEVKGMNKASLRAAMNRGNVGAAMELFERGDLENDEFEKVMGMLPQGSAAREKVNQGWQKKDPVNAIMGKDIRVKLSTGAQLSASEDAHVKSKRDDLQKALKRIAPEDYAKLDAKDLKAAIRAGVGMPITRSQLNAVFDSSNTEMQEQASAYVDMLRNKGVQKPGEQTIVAHARKMGLKPGVGNGPGGSLLPGSGTVTT